MNSKKNNNIEKFYVTSDDAGTRLDMFLCSIYPGLSRNFLQKQIKNGNILLNDKTAKPSYVLKIDDTVKVEICDETVLEIKAEDLPLDVLFEDEEMAVINKPKNMLTHPTSTEKSGTLVNALLNKFDHLSNCNGAMRPGIVHRLDRNTSGLLMIAKTNNAYESLKEQMQKRTVIKKYYAVVSGNFEEDEGTINEPIGRHISKPEKMAVREDGKPSVTHYKVLERLNGYTLLDINLETGRTHQIRVHMAYIRRPIVCDSLYGGAKLPVKTTEQALQAYSLTFRSPEDNIERTITLDFDNDIIKVLNYLRNRK